MPDLLIACSDGRLNDTLARFQERRRMPAADRLLVPGGPLVLVRPGMERRVCLECIRVLVDSHAPKRLVLVSHQDCAAYERALGGFGFDQREILERDLRRVRTLLENEFPQLQVSCWFIPWQERAAGAGYGEAQRVS